MREIKFRAKRNDMDRWIYGQYFTTPLTDENSGTKPDAGWFFLTGEKRHCIVQNCVAFVIDLKTLGQYTGLKDKNGKEIYESDIYHLGDKRILSVVEWHDTGFMGKQIGTLGSREGLKHWCDRIEVISNIHDNPELLKEIN
jgi:uncharacterized phage protein (TIGR01671 family)